MQDHEPDSYSFCKNRTFQKEAPIIFSSPPRKAPQRAQYSLLQSASLPAARFRALHVHAARVRSAAEACCRIFWRTSCGSFATGAGVFLLLAVSHTKCCKRMAPQSLHWTDIFYSILKVTGTRLVSNTVCMTETILNGRIERTTPEVGFATITQVQQRL